MIGWDTDFTDDTELCIRGFSLRVFRVVRVQCLQVECWSRTSRCTGLIKVADWVDEDLKIQS
jgi:hypothetical protein